MVTTHRVDVMNGDFLVLYYCWLGINSAGKVVEMVALPMHKRRGDT